MPKVFASVAASLLALGALAMGSTVSAFAYASQGTSGATTSPTSVGPGGTTTFTTTFKDVNGAGVAGATVTFSQQSGPANCTVTFGSTTGTTDANGVASTSVKIPASCPGTYVLAGATQGVSVTASVTETGGFPATSAAAPTSGWPVLALAVAGLAIIAASSTALSRRRPSL